LLTSSKNKFTLKLLHLRSDMYIFTQINKCCFPLLVVLTCARQTHLNFENLYASWSKNKNDAKKI